MGRHSDTCRRHGAGRDSRSRRRSHSRSRQEGENGRHRRSRHSSHSTVSPIDRLTDVMTALLKTTKGESTKTARGEMIPWFDPEDREQNAEMWCGKVDEVREIFRWTEETTIYYALSRMRGLAEVWYKGLPTLRFSWAEWKIKIQTAFPSQRDYYEALNDMMRRTKQPGETYAKYFYEK